MIPDPPKVKDVEDLTGTVPESVATEFGTNAFYGLSPSALFSACKRKPAKKPCEKRAMAAQVSSEGSNEHLTKMPKASAETTAPDTVLAAPVDTNTIKLVFEDGELAADKTELVKMSPFFTDSFGNNGEDIQIVDLKNVCSKFDMELFFRSVHEKE